MGQRKLQSQAIWKLAKRQHGVIARHQLLAMGLNSDAVQHRVAKGRLHPIHRGVYAVGRPDVTRFGAWMAGVLACGANAVLSHASAAELWALCQVEGAVVEVSTPGRAFRRRPGIVVHRRLSLASQEISEHLSIPVTTPACTLIDTATRLTPDQLEAAINEANRRDLIDPDALRNVLDQCPQRAGVGALRRTLDARTFTLTDSELERRFLPVARRAGLPRPFTQQWLNGFKVDFFWPELGLVVETDGLRYHRTAAQQTRDRLRDQVHTSAGLTPLRFTHAQVRYEARHVEETLATTARRLRERQRRQT
jgi:very-short-patch-repair endonuclease/predicted transcriptional regulator of viral defense system